MSDAGREQCREASSMSRSVGVADMPMAPWRMAASSAASHP